MVKNIFLDPGLGFFRKIGFGFLVFLLTFILYKLKVRRDLKKWTQRNFMNINYIRTLNGFQFEDYVDKQLRNLGINTRQTPKSGDFGIDIIIEEEYAIQLKNYKSSVGISAIQEAYAGGAYYNKKPVVLATNYYTGPAVELAEKIGVELIDLRDINNWSSLYYKRSYNHRKGAFELISSYLIKDLNNKLAN